MYIDVLLRFNYLSQNFIYRDCKPIQGFNIIFYKSQPFSLITDLLPVLLFVPQAQHPRQPASTDVALVLFLLNLHPRPPDPRPQICAVTGPSSINQM